jgi:hypothetical protein|tara:strand:- start:3247 stop:3657 length:411 start_codon:yes stop_codon:yes gene_type:complete
MLFGVSSAFPRNNIDRFTKNLLNDFKSNKYASFYEKMSEETKKLMSYEDMKKLFDLEKDVLGSLRKFEKLESLEQVVKEKTVTTLRYTAKFSKTGALIILVVVEENEKLKCHKFYVDSLIFSKPEIQEQFKALKDE